MRQFRQTALLAVATGKSRRGLDDELDIHDAGALFVASRTSDMTQSKPHPQMLLEILHETGFSPDNTIMVGDSALDMQLAQNAGVLGIGVGFGAELETDLVDSGASFCAQTWPELVRHIEGLVA
ncbi:hypothetical protein CYMTET_7799 [Cymbomonas tetramitiformis]|uniref:Phosphoglycolate phosphatase n=1 Tax=Cymbomonas tetramitiformis TaxID=36881 RepID=A0AAE0GUB2_9CHLO|nr:hypothetical protein CYMTET_7799 [Cymbomonas tetramitiformis]